MDAAVATELNPPVNPFLLMGHSKLPSASLAFDANYDAFDWCKGKWQDGFLHDLLQVLVVKV